MALFVGLYLAMKLFSWIDYGRGLGGGDGQKLEDGWRVNVVQILVLRRTVLS
jgi:hypothetical protein